jgi:hypothetical protein
MDMVGLLFTVNNALIMFAFRNNLASQKTEAARLSLALKPLELILFLEEAETALIGTAAHRWIGPQPEP